MKKNAVNCSKGKLYDVNRIKFSLLKIMKMLMRLTMLSTSICCNYV